MIIMDFDLPMIDVRPVDGPEVIKVEPTAQSGHGTGTDRLRSGCRVLPETYLLPFALFFLLIPDQYAQSLYIEGGRLDDRCLIGTANGSEAVTWPAGCGRSASASLCCSPRPATGPVG